VVASENELCHYQPRFFRKEDIMNRFAIIVLVCFALVLSARFAPCAPATANLKDVVAAVEKSYNSLADIESSFTQKTYIASMKREQTGNGTLAIKKNPSGPAMFRFDYRKPRQLIVSDGSKVWFYLPENKQVMVADIKTLFEGGKGVTLNYLTGIGRISRDFTITFLNGGRDAKGNYLLELIPRQPSQALAKLRLTVAAEAVEHFEQSGKGSSVFPLVSSVVFDAIGTRTTIDFSNVTVNRGVKNSLFTFKVPAGVEVVRQ
jgi:outer membrane lipoprotein carrier protein